jgi:NAD dependent epimerase/dehydratase family enzyme
MHRRDLCRICVFAAHQPVNGHVLDAVAPNPVLNLEFTRDLADALGKGTLPSVPAFILKAGLGEMASVVLASQRVRPEAMLRVGFRFDFESLPEALADIVRR